MTMGSLHELRPDAFRYVWDHSVEPALEVEPGDEVLLHARDASDEQIRRDSTAEAVIGIDFSHVNPVSGPVFVKGALPGDVLSVEILALRPGDWGWTAIIPGLGLLAEEFPEPWLRISEVDAKRRVVRLSDRVVLPLGPREAQRSRRPHRVARRDAGRGRPSLHRAGSRQDGGPRRGLTAA
jgi:acetamidase/formamidase